MRVTSVGGTVTVPEVRFPPEPTTIEETTFDWLAQVPDWNWTVGAVGNVPAAATGTVPTRVLPPPLTPNGLFNVKVCGAALAGPVTPTRARAVEAAHARQVRAAISCLRA
nr:hypothetical protein Ade03nite_12770 [Actinoplanes derwentensis]